MSYCHPCNAERRRDWYAANKKRARKASSEKRTVWLGVTYEKPITRNTAANRVIRLEVLNELGGRCVCCQEDRQEFLTVDHIKGGGNAHRKEDLGTYFFRRLRREGLSKRKYRVLCYNCNCSLAHRGYCPHGNL